MCLTSPLSAQELTTRDLNAPSDATTQGSAAPQDQQVDDAQRALLEGLATGPEPENGDAPAILPYTITGTFDDPIVTPDVGRILRRQGTTPQP